MATQTANGETVDGRLAPLPQMEVRIVPSAEPLDGGVQSGQIEIRGPALFSGYLGEPSRSAEDWFSTGDWGALHVDGLEVLDRCDDMLITGGENVAPAAVEQALEEHPDIQQACVLGVEDAQWGQRIVAVAQRSDGAAEPVEGYETFLRQHLASFKRPRRTVWVAELPLTAGGKLDRVACGTIVQAAEALR